MSLAYKSSMQIEIEAEGGPEPQKTLNNQPQSQPVFSYRILRKNKMKKEKNSQNTTSWSVSVIYCLSYQ